MGARALMFFNPAFQIVARAMARDAELRADDRACERPDERLALASALLKLYRATEGRAPAARRTLPLAGAFSGPLRRARAGDMEARCRRLIEAGPSGRLPFLAPRLALTAGALATMLFFVT